MNEPEMKRDRDRETPRHPERKERGRGEFTALRQPFSGLSPGDNCLKNRDTDSWAWVAART